MCYKKSFITQFFEIVWSSEMQVEFHFKIILISLG